MTLQGIAIRNLLRRKGKAAFIVAGLAIGIATVVGVISYIDAMTGDINHKLEKYGANILIVPQSENMPLTYGGLSMGGVSFEIQEIRESDLARVKSIKNARNIAALGPLVLGVVRVEDHKVLLAGVDFKSTHILKPWWRIDGQLPAQDSVIVGAEAARILNLNRSSILTLNNRRLSVSGILQPTGSQDDRLLFTSLPTAQAILNKTGRISMVEVAALCHDCPIDDMVSQIADSLPDARVMAIQQVVKGRMETLAQLKTFSMGVSAVVVLIAGLVVLVTMMGSVRERTEEIGIFRAIGFRRGHVIRIIFMEAGILSALAGIAGYVVGFGSTIAGLRWFNDDRMIHVPFNLELALTTFALAVIIGMLSSAYPALVAARMDPNDALRAL